jgi:hypothetical protein
MPKNLVQKVNQVLWPAMLALALVVSEWLFFITKPSFLSVAGIGSATIVLLILASTLIILLGLPLLLFLLLGELYSKSLQKPVLITANIIAAFIAATIVLLLFDNFSHTVFGVGISTSTLFLKRIFYLVLWILLIFYFGIKKPGTTAAIQHKPWIIRVEIFITMVGIIVMLSTAQNAWHKYIKDESARDVKLYNVIVLSSDGVESTNMSVYGYDRDTTPFLRSISDDLLISENSFVNNGHTTGSIISLLTGVLPTTSKVSYPPDILKGLYAYRHWPGIMLMNGYKTLDISTRYYADAFDLNLRDGFVEANFRSVSSGSINNVAPPWYQIHFPEAAYFLQVLADKITSKLQHILFISNRQITENPSPMLLIPQPLWHKCFIYKAYLLKI